MSYYIYMLIICISKLIDIIYNNKYVIESIIQVKRYVYNSNNSYMIIYKFLLYLLISYIH